MLTRCLALTLSFSIAFAPISGQAMPTRVFCRVVLDAPTAEVTHDQLTLKHEIEAKTLQLNEQLQEHWNQQQTEIMATAVVRQKFFDLLTPFFMRSNKHPYAQTYLKIGIPQKVRSWIHAGVKKEEKTNAQIDEWIERYSSYPNDRQKLIERTAAIQVEEKMLKAAIDRKVFPLELEIPLMVEETGEIRFETRRYKNEKGVEADIETLERAEGDRFNTFWSRHFGNRRFLEGRDLEQATLRNWLEIVQSELQRFPDALRNQQQREDRLNQLNRVLTNKDWSPPPYSIFIETRRLFFEEVSFYNGFGRTFESEAIEPNQKLRPGDKIDFGIFQPNLGLIMRGLRMFTMLIPLQVPALLFAWAIPATNHAYEIYLQPESYINTIVDQPDDVYKTKATAFLKDRYEVVIAKDGHVTMNKSGLEAAQRLQVAHEKYKQTESRRTKAQASLNDILSNPHEILDPKVFSSVMHARSDADAVKILTRVKASSREIQDIAQYRAEYHARIAKHQNSATVISAIYSDFSMEPEK